MIGSFFFYFTSVINISFLFLIFNRSGQLVTCCLCMLPSCALKNWRKRDRVVINKWESGKGSFLAAQRYHPITSLHIGLSEKSHWSAQSLLFSTNRYPSSQTVTKPSRSNPASTWQAWECVSLWYHTTPIDRGAIERAQWKTRTAATSLATITDFFCDMVFDMSPSDLMRVSAGLASRGRGVGCACRKVGEKTSTLHSIAPRLVVLSPPLVRKRADKQISRGAFSPFSSPLSS